MPFADITGHRTRLLLLSQAVAGGTLPSSLILAGPAGVGKRRVAMAIAQALNCTDPRGDRTHAAGFAVDGCGTCSTCRRISRGLFPDLLIVERNADRLEIRIEQIREAVGQSAFRPFEGRMRLVVIDDASEMNTDAQDALLKSLEEPPSGTAFLLLTAWPDSLRPTIRSRCALMRFGPLDVEEIVAALVSEHHVSEADARTFALAAEGSLGRAVELSATDASRVRETLVEALGQVVEAAGPMERVAVGSRLVGLASSSGAGSPDRQALAVHLRVLASLVRDLTVLTTSAQGDGPLTNPDLSAELGRLAARVGRDRAMRAFQAVERAIGALERNANAKIVADWLALQL